jgi:flavodoxin I
MKKTAIFYGSTIGNTETVAQQIAEKLGAELYNVAYSSIDKVQQYQNLILGTSTWGVGDLQDDWEGFLPALAKVDLTGKIIALFGLGDSSSYPDTFVDGMGTIYEALKEKGCTIVGMVDPKEYNFDDSSANIDGKFVGLPLDEDNESDQTEKRVAKWLEQILPAFT